MPHQCTTCERTFPDGSKEMLSGCPDCGGNKFQFTPQSRATNQSVSAGSTPHEGIDSEASIDKEASNGSNRSTAAGDVQPTESNQSQSDPTNSRATSHSTQNQLSESPENRDWPESAKPPAERLSANQPSDGGQSASRASTEPVESQESVDESGSKDDGTEDVAQATARSEVVSSGELARKRAGSPNHGSSPVESELDRDGPDTIQSPSPHEADESVDTDDRPTLAELREELNDQFESIKIVRPGEYELNLMELYDREEYIVSLQEDGRYVIDVPDSWRDGSDES